MKNRRASDLLNALCFVAGALILAFAAHVPLAAIGYALIALIWLVVWARR